MKKLYILCLILTITMLSSCSNRKRDNISWEREKLTSNLEISGQRGQDLLDRDLAECVNIVASRQHLEEKILDTKKCVKKGGKDWKAPDRYTFLKQCMKDKGWIPSKCCSYK